MKRLHPRIESLRKKERKMIFFKKIQDFIIAQPLNEMILFFNMMLHQNNINVAKPKKRSGGLLCEK
jgi:hypothetical protein